MYVTTVRTFYKKIKASKSELRLVEERLENRLIDLGFTKDESKIYIFLLKMGPCPAGLVARKFKINRMKAYRMLRALVEKNLVNSIIGRPVMYTVAPIREILKLHIDKLREKLTGIEDSENEIISDVAALSLHLEPISEEHKFRIFQGRQQIYALIVQMCERVVNEIDLLLTGNDLIRLSLSNIDDNLKRLVSDGIQVRILTQVDENVLEYIENYLDFINIHHIPLPAPMRIFILDEKEILTAVAMDDTMSMTTQFDTGIWTDASSFVKTMKIFFKTLWDTSPEARIVIESIKTGILPEEIKIITTHESYVGTFLKMIEQSKTSIEILVKNFREIPLSIQKLSYILDKKNSMRLLTQVNLESLDDVISISKSASVMHMSRDSELQILIVDGSEALLFLPDWGTEGQAVWSNLKTYVETIVQIFEDYWKSASPIQKIISELTNKDFYFKTLNAIRRDFEQSSWVVETPGGLKGESGTRHLFDIVVRSPDIPDKPIALKLVVEGRVFNSLIELSVLSSDLESAVIFLASTNPFTKTDLDLADLYGIKLIHEPEVEFLIKKISDEAKKSV